MKEILKKVHSKPFSKLIRDQLSVRDDMIRLKIPEGMLMTYIKVHVTRSTLSQYIFTVDDSGPSVIPSLEDVMQSNDSKVKMS